MNINGTQSANANLEVSSAASTDANTNANIKFLRLFASADADTRSIANLYFVCKINFREISMIILVILAQNEPI